MVEKVTDPTKVVTDQLVVERLTEQAIDPAYVEFWHDYAPRSWGKEYNPYAKFYRDLKSGKKLMVVSGLPMVKVEGNKILPAWYYSEIQGKWYSRANLFSAVVDGTHIQATCLSDQPPVHDHARKAGDQATWQPQVFLDGKEVKPKSEQPEWLEVDPTCSDLHQNTLEWDYGFCKRRARLVQGRLRDTFRLESDPQGEVKIVNNIDGNMPLVLGSKDWNGIPIGRVEGDVEVISKEELVKADYPIHIGASPETFYPDAHDEDTSFDGQVSHQYTAGSGEIWTTIRGEAGSVSSDDDVFFQTYIKCDTTGNNDDYLNIQRPIILFDTSGLPDTCTITGAVLSAYGYWKSGTMGGAINIYSSAPASNVVIANGDYDSLGTTELSTEIAYADWNTAGFNAFTLIDVDTDGFGYIKKTAGDPITKLGQRESDYDGTGTEPTWAAAVYTAIRSYSADQGGATVPKLVVTYTTATQYNESASVIIGSLVLASRAAEVDRASSTIIGELVTATRLINYPRLASVIIGLLAAATRTLVTTRVSTILVGAKTTASRIANYPRLATVTIAAGIVGIFSKLSLEGDTDVLLLESGDALLLEPLFVEARTLAATRESSVLVGTLVAASRFVEYSRLALVITGIKATALRLINYPRLSSVIIGQKIAATRTLAATRASSVKVGLVVTSSRLINYPRLASVLLGEVVTATRQINYPRLASVIVGARVAASRLINYPRAAVTKVGVVASASRTLAVTRASSVVLGIVAVGLIVESVIRERGKRFWANFVGVRSWATSAGVRSWAGAAGLRSLTNFTGTRDWAEHTDLRTVTET